MIDIHLPIADVSISVLLLIALGGGVGFLSGLFGVGDGQVNIDHRCGRA